MENNKPIENSNEKGPGKILSKEEIMLFFMDQKDGQTLIDVREDEKGIYLLETSCPGDIEGETYEYQYIRKGSHENGKHQALVTSFYRMTYDADGIPYGGKTLADFDEETRLVKLYDYKGDVSSSNLGFSAN